MKRFEYGVCEWSVKARGEALCKIAAKAGLDSLQLGVGEEVFSGNGLGSRDIIEAYKSATASYNIAISSLSPQFVDQYSFTMPQNNQEELVAEELVERTIELCGEFGCNYFLLPVLGRNDICDGPSFHRGVECIKRFADKAGSRGIKTYLEVNQSVEQVHNLLDAVDNPLVKIFFDSQNMYALYGTSMARYFKELEVHIGGVHVKDGKGNMLSGSLLGEGDSGFYKTAKAICDSDYAGCILIESVYNKATVAPFGGEEELLEKDSATLHRVFEL